MRPLGSGLTLRLVQLQLQPGLGLVLRVQTLQQLLLFSHHLRHLFLLAAEFLLKTRMNLTCFLQLGNI